MVNRGTDTAEVVVAILGTRSDPRCSVLFLVDDKPSSTSLFTGFMSHRPPWSVTVFEATEGGQNANVTLTKLSRVVAHARRVRQVSWCVTVVVASDDLAFLSTFALWSLKGRLLVWSTRLLVVTRLPLHHLQVLHGLLSSTNSILLIAEDIPRMLRCRLFVYLPYTSREDLPERLATWTPQRGFVVASSLPFFPDKYTRFLRRPQLVAATEALNSREVTKVKSDGGSKDYMMLYLAQGLNFTYKYVSTADGSFGSKQDDGSWSGMVGMVSRKEADFSIGPFGMTESRTEVIDFTWPFTIQYSMIMGARGRPVVDPWGFVLPLEPLVWAAILTALLVLPVVMVLLASCSSVTTLKQYTWGKDIFDLTRILLQQDYRASAIVGWRRLVLVAWMVLGLVVSRSYQGDLMSGLAVRHIRQPFQTIRDVLDHPTITMLWQTNSTNVQYFRAVESGIFREVAEAETKSRVKYKLLSEFPQAINTLVRRGDHVLIDLEIVITMIIGQYFTHTGRCDFYSSRERFLPMVLSMIGQRDSPLVPALSKRIMSFSEAGLYEQWFKDTVPNATSCVHPPSKIAVSTSLSLANLWGMFVVLIGGHVLAVFLLVLEVTSQHWC
ncbi:probable glutamate receptor [Procambarus clarkii]|uniref:probable glutamate receptor n=1 Tax=Procambarus clarkii TaxID=6728 RepID=UPI0037431967